MSYKQEAKEALECYRRNMEHVLGKDSSEVKAIKTCITLIDEVEDKQQWIPIKTRPMTEDERQYFEEQVGVELSDDEAVFFDCPMPDDGQRIWVQSVNGYIWDDTCERDDFIGLEGNGDWDTIVAWMPMIIPEQYKGIEDGKRK